MRMEERESLEKEVLELMEIPIHNTPLFIEFAQLFNEMKASVKEKMKTKSDEELKALIRHMKILEQMIRKE